MDINTPSPTLLNQVRDLFRAYCHRPICQPSCGNQRSNCPIFAEWNSDNWPRQVWQAHR